MRIAVSGSGTIPDAGNGGMVEGWNTMPKIPVGGSTGLGKLANSPRIASSFNPRSCRICAPTLLFPQHPKQQMFRTDRAVPESHGLFCRIGENAFALEGKRHVYRGRQFRFFSNSLRDCVMNIGPRGLIAGETFGDVSVFA